MCGGVSVWWCECVSVSVHNDVVIPTTPHLIFCSPSPSGGGRGGYYGGK